MNQPGLRIVSNAIRLRAWRVGILALPIQVCYFTIFYLGLRTGKTFSLAELLLLVFALWLYLAYIVLINDLVDRGIDAAAGKGTVERGHGLSPSFVAFLLVLIVLANSAVVVAIGSGAVFDALWVLAYVLGTAYSAPPFSLKRRGLAGLVADSVMEKPIPILIVFAFFGYLGIETLLFPILGELLDAVFKHQALDHDADVKTGVRTYAVVLGKERSERMVEFIHGADILMVVLAFLTVLVALPEVRAITAVWLGGLVLAFALASVKLRRYFFHPGSENWSAPMRWADPPYVVLFNSGFQALLTTTLGVALTMRSPVYLPVLLLFLLLLAPFLFSYAVVALVRLHVLGKK
jgi:4-hydroxybenzoate polyprenyltransferase